MQRYAIVKNGVVVNVIEYETQPTTPPDGFPEGHIAVQASRVSIGWTYANNQFTDPNPAQAIQTLTPVSLTDMILADPVELAKLRTALGIV